MADELSRKWEISRRRVIETMAKAAGIGVLGILPGASAALAQAGGPWSQAPKSKVDRLNFVVWTYGDIYTRISKQFEADWGIKVESNISSFNDHPAKLTTMFAAGERIDVSQSSPFSFPNFVDQGLAEPIDGLPGASDYIKDFSGFTKQVAQFGGKTMGLPYFSAIWVWNYYTELLEKAKIDKPFATYDELIEHCVKAKKDGIARYPILWVAGWGLGAAARHLVFDHLPPGARSSTAGQPHAGRGSIAREVLKWWATLYEKGLDIADPEFKVQFTSSAEAFGAGRTCIVAPTTTMGLTSPTIPQSPSRQGQGPWLAG
jgi:ABC-type glycerol-3-phosphate transport system substrate-binding protein